MTVLNDSVFSFPLPLSLWLQLDEAWVSTPVNQTTVLSEQKLREPIFWEVKVKLLSFDRLFMTPWTAGYQAPPSMGFVRQEYWSGNGIGVKVTFWRWISGERPTVNAMVLN